MNDYMAHPTAFIEESATIGEGTKIWHNAQIRSRARIGARCIIGKGAFVDFGVVVGDDCKIQNYACVYHGVVIGRGVFIGPHVVFVNDIRPRATDRAFRQLGEGEWEVGATIVGDGAAFGANSTILTNVRIGKWALIAAGAVVTRSVEPYALVVGSPARRTSWVCVCGRKLSTAVCGSCGELPADHPLRN
jgi:acetyltransferase-like isoleucine patch superfamily enzyme